jgi:hypothetical protein
MKTLVIMFITFLGTSALENDSIVTKIPNEALEVAMANSLGAESVEIGFIRPYDTSPKIFDINFVAKLRDKKFQLDCLLREHGLESGALVALSYMVEIRRDECIVSSEKRFSDTLNMHIAGFSVDGYFQEGSRVVLLPVFFLIQIAEQLAAKRSP